MFGADKMQFGARWLFGNNIEYIGKFVSEQIAMVVKPSNAKLTEKSNSNVFSVVRRLKVLQQ